jgi:hypothetical protein
VAVRRAPHSIPKSSPSTLYPCPRSGSQHPATGVWGASIVPQPTRVAVLCPHDHDLCAVDLGLEHEAFSVHQQVSLSAFDFLATVVATLFSGHPGRFDRLAIHYACAGLKISSRGPAPAHARLGASSPGAIDAPYSEIVVDGLPGWELVGQKSLGAATSYYVEVGVKDLTRAVDPRPS